MRQMVKPGECMVSVSQQSCLWPIGAEGERDRRIRHEPVPLLEAATRQCAGLCVNARKSSLRWETWERRLHAAGRAGSH